MPFLGASDGVLVPFVEAVTFSAALYGKRNAPTQIVFLYIMHLAQICQTKNREIQILELAENISFKKLAGQHSRSPQYLNCCISLVL